MVRPLASWTLLGNVILSKKKEQGGEGYGGEEGENHTEPKFALEKDCPGGKKEGEKRG